MKILLVTGIYPPDHGGPASYVPLISKELQLRKHQVTSVITLSDSHDVTNAITDGFPVHRIYRKQNLLIRWIKTIRLILTLSKHADVVYLNGLVLEGIIATKIINNKPAVIKVVGDLIWEKARNQASTNLELDDFQNKSIPWRWQLLRQLQNWYTQKADFVITPSQYLAKIVSGWGIPDSKICVVYNASDKIQATDSISINDKSDLVTVARLVPWKGLAELIQISAKNHWSLRIVGDGPQRNDLEKLARELNANIQFVGHVEKSEVAYEIKKGCIFVLNSSYEGLPHIILEAKLAGVPVVATSAGGTPETIEHGINGWLVPVADSLALEAQLEFLLNNETLCEQSVIAAKSQMVNKFSLKRMVDDTERILLRASSNV